jgi:hypothetical protein
MKHLKTYKIFESSPEGTKQYLKDIFLDIQDKGIEFVGISSSTSNGELHTCTVIIGDRKTSQFRARMEPNTKTFLLADVYDSIQMAKSYMSDEGFFISEIRVQSPDKYGDFKVYSLLYSYNLYEEGKGKLFEKPITYLELKFNK